MLGILALLLRALVAPIMLILTVVLSFAAALGVSVLFFNNVFNFGAADTSFPLFVFVFLVALGIDYNIFLMTRVREEAHKHGPKTGALTGLAVTGGVITSAGAVSGDCAAAGLLALAAAACGGAGLPGGEPEPDAKATAGRATAVAVMTPATARR
ncbi:MAG TPA: MMPL family transporter [Trebonia sp.]